MTVTNVSIVDFYDLCQQLQLDINNWLLSPTITNISRQLRAALNPTSEIRVIIETQDIIIQKLPWHCSSFFKDYPKAEVSFARTEYQRTYYFQVPKVQLPFICMLKTPLQQREGSECSIGLGSMSVAPKKTL